MFAKKILFLTLLCYSIQNALADEIVYQSYDFYKINYGVCGFGCNGVEEIYQCYYSSTTAIGYLMRNCTEIAYCASSGDSHGPGGTSLTPICPFPPPEDIAPTIIQPPEEIAPTLTYEVPAPEAPLLHSTEEPTPPSGRGPLPIDERYLNGI